MSKIYKLVSPSTGKISWKIYWYDPEGKQKSKTFGNKKVAEAYQAKVQVSKKEMRYHDVFDVKKETRITFNALLDDYEDFLKLDRPKSYATRLYVFRELREAFGERRLSQITFQDLETYRNRRKATPTRRAGSGPTAASTTKWPISQLSCPRLLSGSFSKSRRSRKRARSSSSSWTTGAPGSLANLKSKPC